MAAGTQYVDGRIPGQRIETTVETSDSSTFTTSETEVMSVTAPLVSGRTYRVRFWGTFNSTVNGDRIRVKVREDDSSGTQLAEHQMVISTTASTTGYLSVVEVEFTAASTGNQTFVVTGERLAGSGSINREGATNRPSYLYVDYIRG